MKRFCEVTPGLLRGGEPSDDEVRVLKDGWGVKRIISLDLDAGEKIRPICSKLGIDHIILPIEMDNNPSKSKMKEAIKLLSDNVVFLLSQNPPTYVHCIHGRDRTGLAVALFRVKAHGWSASDALKEALAMDFGDGLSEDDSILFEEVIDKAHTETRDSNSNKSSAPAPVQDFFHDHPAEDISQADDKARKRRRLLRKMYLEDMNEAMAYVGLNDINPMLRGTYPYGSGPLGMPPYINYYY